MKKKTLKFALCYLSAFAMLASGVVSVSASDLTAEELFDKYGDYYVVNFFETNYEKKMERYQKFQRWVADYGWTVEDLIEQGYIESVEAATEDYLNAGWCYKEAPRRQTSTLTYVNQDGEPYDGYPQTEEEWEELDILSSIRHHNAYISYTSYSADSVVANCECADGFYYAEYELGKATIAGVNLQWLKETQPTKLVIPEEIGGLTVTRIQQGACCVLYRFDPNLEEVVIPDTVEEIQGWAFSGTFAEDVTRKGKINIPQNVKVIEQYAFWNSVHGIAADGNVVLPESIEYVDLSAFYQNGFKTSAVLPESCAFVTERSLTYSDEDAEVTAVGGDTCVTLEDAYQYQRARVEAGELITCLTNCNEASGRIAYGDGEKFAELHPQFYQSAAVEPKPVTVQGTGDLDGDGKLSISDAVLLSRYVAEDTTVSITAEGIAQADLDGSGIIDAGDIATVLKQIAGL